MDPIVRTSGVVEKPGHIAAQGLPFKAGQEVELVVWPVRSRPSKRQINDARERFEKFCVWVKANSKGLPVLPREALRREALYDDRV